MVPEQKRKSGGPLKSEGGGWEEKKTIFCGETTILFKKGPEGSEGQGPGKKK